MQIGIDTSTKTINLYSRVKISELLETLTNIGINFEEWFIHFDCPQPIQPIYPKPDFDKPWISPPWIIGDQPYTQPYTNPWTTGTPHKPMEIWYNYMETTSQ